MTAVFLVPTRTFESTGTVVEEYGLEPELIPIHTGNEIAMYVYEPLVPNWEAPVYFITGGTGGDPSHGTKLNLDEYARLGFTVYLYAPIGCGKSLLLKDTDTSSYSMVHEAELIRDNMKQISLIVSFYGGNVAARHRNKIYVFEIIFLWIFRRIGWI